MILDPLRNTGGVPVALVRLALVGLLLYAHEEDIRPQLALPAVELRLQTLLVLSAEVGALLGRFDILDGFAIS